MEDETAVIEYSLEGTFPVPHDILESEKFKRLRLSSKYMYCYLAKLRNRFGKNQEEWFWHPMHKLSEEIGINLKTLKKAKKELLQNHFIEVKRGKYRETNRRAADWYKVLGFKETVYSPQNTF